MIRLNVAAAAALLSAVPAAGQTSITPDLSGLTPVVGRWSWAATPDGSEATFVDAGGRAQVSLHCSRVARTVSIARPASGVTPFMLVWASSMSRNIPASYNPATARITVQLSASDTLLDALAFSRGRIGIGPVGTAPLVVPAWPEIARVIEDCRA